MAYGFASCLTISFNAINVGYSLEFFLLFIITFQNVFWSTKENVCVEIQSSKKLVYQSLSLPNLEIKLRINGFSGNDITELIFGVSWVY